MKTKHVNALLLSALLLSGCGNAVATTAELPLNSEPTAPLPIAAQAAPTETPPAAQPLSRPAEEPAFQTKGNRDVVYSVSGKATKEIALTFDDGPDTKYTSRILDILKEQHVPATFFVIGQHAEKYPQMMKRIAQEGHVIGNHSWDHANMAKLDQAQVNEEIAHTDQVIKEITGETTTLFRPPYGAISQPIVTASASSGHKIINWSVDTLDWDGKNAAAILAALKKEARPGAIVLQHSAGGKGGNLNATVEALPQMIEYLRKEGYTFVTVPDLLAGK